MMLAESLLQRGQILIERQTFYRGNTGSVRLDGEHQTGPHRFAVHDDGAGAAHAMLAAEMRPCQTQTITQAIGQSQARLDCQCHGVAVYRETNGNSAVVTSGHGQGRVQRG